MELNNGGPSGGHIVDLNRESLLINMLHISQNSEDFSKVGSYLLAMNSDYSLIINTADKTLYLKRSLFDNETWSEVNLTEHFSSMPHRVVDLPHFHMVGQ